MIRLTNIQLPLDHDEHAIKQAVIDRLQITTEELIDITVFRRGYDARKKTAILLIYTLDVDTAVNSTLLDKFADDPLVKLSPDLTYRHVAAATAV